MNIFIIDYIWHNYEGQEFHHINQEGFKTLEEAQKWCERNGVEQVTPMRYHWVENGDCYYNIYEILIH